MKTLTTLAFLLCLCGTANADTCENTDNILPAVAAVTATTPPNPWPAPTPVTDFHVQPAGLNGCKPSVTRPAPKRRRR